MTCKTCGIELVLKEEEVAGKCLTCQMIEQQNREPEAMKG